MRGVTQLLGLAFPRDPATPSQPLSPTSPELEGPALPAPVEETPADLLEEDSSGPERGEARSHQKQKNLWTLQSGLETWILVPAPNLLLRHTQRSGQVFLCLWVPCQSWGGVGASQAESPFWLLGAWAAPSPTSYLWVFLCIENAPCSPPSLCPSESRSWHEACLQSSLTVPASPSEHFAHSPSQNSTLPAHLTVCLHRQEPPTACLPPRPRTQPVAWGFGNESGLME